MIYEQRLYDVSPAVRPLYIKFLGDEAIPYMVKYGAKLVALLETAIGERNQIIVLLGWKDHGHRQRCWDKILKDQDFLKLTETCGANSLKVSILHPTKYSPLK